MCVRARECVSVCVCVCVCVCVRARARARTPFLSCANLGGRGRRGAVCGGGLAVAGVGGEAGAKICGTAGATAGCAHAVDLRNAAVAAATAAAAAAAAASADGCLQCGVSAEHVELAALNMWLVNEVGGWFIVRRGEWLLYCAHPGMIIYCSLRGRCAGADIMMVSVLG